MTGSAPHQEIIQAVKVINLGKEGKGSIAHHGSFSWGWTAEGGGRIGFLRQ